MVTSSRLPLPAWVSHDRGPCIRARPRSTPVLKHLVVAGPGSLTIRANLTKSWMPGPLAVFMPSWSG